MEVAAWSQANDQRLAFTAIAVQAALGTLNEQKPDGLARLSARSLNDDARIEADVSRPRVGARRAKRPSAARSAERCHPTRRWCRPRQLAVLHQDARELALEA
jgi:hypothetical protein